MTAQSDSLLGKAFDDYRIEKPLGVGGMAKVYRALDVKLKRYVAIKVIASDLRTEPEYIERFEREAQSIARLEHANIVRIYRFGEVDGLYYMAMQYVEGADLSALIRDYKASGEVMPIADIVRVVRNIGAALDYAHSRDVLHRDIKPSNILIDQEGNALLTDFGLALLGDMGTRGEILGSPRYISPEQAVSSANVVPQSDLYSLGMTLFEMLTGDLPFTSDEVLDLTLRQMNEIPAPPSQFNAALPPSIDAVVLRALEKEPYDRYGSGSELSAALEQAVAGWQANEPMKRGPVRRPSLVLLPHKVREQLQASPLPSISITPPPTRPVAPNEIPTLEATPRVSRWRGALLFAIIVFLLGAGLILALRPQPTEVGAQIASPSQPEIMITATTQPSESPTPAVTVVAMGSAMLEPTSLPLIATGSPPTALIPRPLPTLVPTIPVSPTAAPPTPASSYELLIARRREDSVFVVNMSAAAFPLAPLRLGDTGAINGSEWGLDTLATNQCVAAWKDSGNPRMPDVSCTQVGARITRDGPNRFWKEAFNVYYQGVLVGTCNADTCSITVTG